jgi:hypothetical protein
MSLDWNYRENEALNIDIYEGNRLHGRSLRDIPQFFNEILAF